MMMQEIKDFESFAASLRNFSKWLPESVQGADIDCVIHAANHGNPDKFLVLEFKRQGQRVSTGQKILFEGLRKLGMAVVVVHEQTEQVDYKDMVFISGDWGPALILLEDFTKRVEQWWKENKQHGH